MSALERHSDGTIVGGQIGIRRSRDTGFIEVGVSGPSGEWVVVSLSEETAVSLIDNLVSLVEDPTAGYAPEASMLS